MSDDIQVKKSSAETEKAWKGAGERVGIQIWRIVKFQVRSFFVERLSKYFHDELIAGSSLAEGGIREVL